MPSPVVSGSARVRGRFRAVSKGCNSVFGKHLGVAEQVSRPQLLWPGLVLLLSPAALVGGVSTPAVACITSTTTSDTVTNNGCINTSGFLQYGILSSGANAAINNTNSGTITTSGVIAYAISSFGANATINNSGTITTTGIAAMGIAAGGANAAINNSGTITTSGVEAFGIYSFAANTAVTNSGTITTSGIEAHGILVQGTGATISNLGTITTGGNAFGIRVWAATGSVATLTNAQGGNTPLTYSGALPTTYTVLVRSLSNFGRLAVTSPSGTMTFGVDATSTLAANRYTDVLTGVAAADITNEET